MHIVASLRRVGEHPYVLLVLGLTLALGSGSSCVRAEPPPMADSASPSNGQQLPFRAENRQTSSSESAESTLSSDSKLTGSLPFHVASRPRILPSGTLLTVQLERPLSSAKVLAGDIFSASVAAPLKLDGDTLIERGTAVTGRVEASQSQTGRRGPSPGSGYFRLTLSGITVSGRQLSLQTSSLFARGIAQPPDGVRVQKGRRLTFRLTAPVTLDDSNSMAARQSPRPSTE
jgi:hypothetical protein